jgi:hypothetical protein
VPGSHTDLADFTILFAGLILLCPDRSTCALCFLETEPDSLAIAFHASLFPKPERGIPFGSFLRRHDCGLRGTQRQPACHESYALVIYLSLLGSLTPCSESADLRFLRQCGKMRSTRIAADYRFTAAQYDGCRDLRHMPMSPRLRREVTCQYVCLSTTCGSLVGACLAPYWPLHQGLGRGDKCTPCSASTSLSLSVSL